MATNNFFPAGFPASTRPRSFEGTGRQGSCLLTPGQKPAKLLKLLNPQVTSHWRYLILMQQSYEFIFAYSSTWSQILLAHLCCGQENCRTMLSTILRQLSNVSQPLLAAFRISSSNSSKLFCSFAVAISRQMTTEVRAIVIMVTVYVQTLFWTASVEPSPPSRK